LETSGFCTSEEEKERMFGVGVGVVAYMEVRPIKIVIALARDPLGWRRT